MITLTDLLKKIWELYTKNFPLWVKLLLIGWIPFLVVSVLGSMLDIFSSPLNFWNILSVLLFLLLTTLVFVAILIAADLRIKNKKVKLQTVLNQAAKKLIPYLLINILTGLVVFAGLFLLVIPAFIFIFWYLFSEVIVVLEEKKLGFRALVESHDLVRGRFWAVVWRTIAVIFVIFVPLYLVIIGLDAVIGFAVYGNPWVALNEPVPTGVIWWSSLIEGTANYLILPLFAGFSVIFYRHLKSLRSPLHKLTRKD